MSLVLGLSGLMVCWPPIWGWIGIAVVVVGCVFSFRGFADPSTSPGDLGYNIAGFTLSGWGLMWGLALQIKHAAGAIDFLLLPLAWRTTLIAAISAFVVFWIAVFVSRRTARTPLLVLAGVALLTIVAAGATTTVLADRDQVDLRQELASAVLPGEAAHD
jgi:ABC-type Fe3+-siderophore transport system permease subunit